MTLRREIGIIYFIQQRLICTHVCMPIRMSTNLAGQLAKPEWEKTGTIQHGRANTPVRGMNKQTGTFISGCRRL